MRSIVARDVASAHVVKGGVLGRGRDWDRAEMPPSRIVTKMDAESESQSVNLRFVFAFQLEPLPFTFPLSLFLIKSPRR